MKRAGLAIGVLFILSLGAGAEPARPDWVKHVIDPGLPAISAVAFDVDGDGRTDVIAAGGPSGGYSKWSNKVFWYQAPDWTKKPVCELRDKAVILHLDTAFLSGAGQAGQPDLIVDDGHFGEIHRCTYNRKTGAWSDALIATNVVGAHGTAAGDIDRDGFPDLAIPSQRGEPRNGMLWIRNPGPAAGTGLWERVGVAPSNTVPGWQEYVRLADLNGDGRLDILHGSHARSGWVGFWLQGADPRMAWDLHPLKGPMAQTTNLDAADLNGDGLPDLVAAEGHGVGLWWFPAPDYPAIRLDDTLKSPHNLALADFNGDAAIDVTACGYGSSNTVCYYNNGTGGFARVVIDTNQCAYDIRAVDLDGDGDRDILLSGQNSGNLVWYENRSRTHAAPRQ
jgi:hypothetical protein